MLVEKPVSVTLTDVFKGLLVLLAQASPGSHLSLLGVDL